MKPSLCPLVSLFSVILACGGTSVIDGGAGGASAASTTNSTTGTSNSASSSSASNGSSTSSGGQGGSGPSCDDLEKSYAAEMMKALVCDPFIDAPQCTKKVMGDLVCQCDLFVNAANGDSIAKLESYQAEYEKLNCMPNIACDCAPATSASCLPNGNSGQCVADD
jgi:hypothetical protein